MGTTREEISTWFDAGVEEGATHMIVVCDTFDFEDYPVYVTAEQNVQEMIEKRGEMQSIMEVYNLKMDKEKQLAEHRAFNV